MKRPNVLLLYTDQQRWDTIGALGRTPVQTPQLDRLAADGALCDTAYVNCPVCMPSRMSMLSSRYPCSLGIAANGVEMPPDITCVQHLLNASDYHTANLGKLHFLNHASYGRDHRDPYPAFGFRTRQISDEPGCYDDAYMKWVADHDPAQVDACRCDTPPAHVGPAITGQPREVHEPYLFAGPEHLSHTAFVADETVSFIRRRAAASEPFFCIAGFYAPHAPINPPERFVELYDEAAMALPVRNPGENYLDVSDAQWQKIKAYYYALISHVDDQIGRILDTLDELDLTEDTLVIFTADHGENLGDHGRIGKGNWHDSSSRVPLILRYPAKIAAGQRRSEIIEAVDLVPTILDFCGLQTPPDMQGRTLRPLLQGDAYEPRDSALIELTHGPGNGYRCVRTADSMYVHCGGGDERLYDLTTDPEQLHDLAGDPAYATRLAALRHTLLQRQFQAYSARRRSAPY